MKKILVFAFGVFIIGSAFLYGQEKIELTVAAAASLKNAYDGDLIPAFKKKYPHITVRGTYDSSGKLQTQIENGLGADIFMSAATTQMDKLVAGGFIDKASVNNLLQNKIVLIKGSSAKTAVKTFNDIPKAKTFAIGDPASVPAGQYAQEALKKLNIWDSIPKTTSLGTNVTEVLNWVAQGSAEIGIVYATDAASNKNVKIIAEIPAGTIGPVIYPIAILAKSTHKAEAKLFEDFLASKEGIAIFKKYGFSKN
ncbi:MAG: molybdate ABC transporter substrate-binding protein [Termitinemataceae bacterium]|nr:MAG: molybdate ABC transporter substrate-binding protein [Termitinemataceae bacterium]